MKLYLLDTNSLLRFLLNDVPEQSDKVVELLDKAKAGNVKLFVAQIVIFEITFILEKYYHFPKEKIIDGLGTLLASSYLEIQDRSVFQEAIELFKTKNIDFVDCFLVSKANEDNAAVFTFDKDLNTLAAKQKKEVPS